MDVKPPPSLEDKWERTQVIGLGSVLITTVTFAAPFTIPEGYNQDHGTPILGRSYMFWAYILANAFAFIQGFISLFAIFLNAVTTMPPRVIEFAVMLFCLLRVVWLWHLNWNCICHLLQFVCQSPFSSLLSLCFSISCPAYGFS